MNRPRPPHPTAPVFNKEERKYLKHIIPLMLAGTFLTGIAFATLTIPC